MRTQLCSKWLGAFAFDVEALMSSLIDDDHDDVAFLAVTTIACVVRFRGRSSCC
jgi:hypothetical protein